MADNKTTVTITRETHRRLKLLAMWLDIGVADLLDKLIVDEYNKNIIDISAMVSKKNNL